MFGIFRVVFVSLAVIATTTDFRVDALPKPQRNDPNFTFVDGFAFEGGADRMIPIGLSSSTRAPSMVPTSRPDVTTTAATTVSPTNVGEEVTRCTQSCRFQTTAEYNPVCGTNQIVYGNPGMLACAKTCGLDVDAAHYGPCTSSIRG